jgi:hypothetical protein
MGTFAIKLDCQKISISSGILLISPDAVKKQCKTIFINVFIFSQPLIIACLKLGFGLYWYGKIFRGVK